MNSLLHIAAIANNPALYADLRRSLAAHGYDESNCRFTLFDNSAANVHEPYAVLRGLASDGDEPYIVLCHQDILFTAETRFNALAAVINDLNARDPRWAVAGNAGADHHCVVSHYLDDPERSWRTAGLPKSATTLDENFLLLNRRNFPAMSSALAGFHFYGTDACLSAIAAGHAGYVVPFPVTHRSGGDSRSVAFAHSRQDFLAAWRPRLLVGLINTTCTYGIVSRYAAVEAMLNWPIVGKALQRCGLSIVIHPRERANRKKPPHTA